MNTKQPDTILEFNNVSKHFGGVKAVRNCSFYVKKGQITGLIGPNGAGKTTAFNLITGLLKTNSGNIIFMNEDITDKPTHYIANKGLARTFQKVRLFDNLTIEENLLLAKHHPGENFFKSFFFTRKPSKSLLKKVKQVVNLVGLTKPLSTLTSELSYGQKRLVELARALMMDYKLLMLDEPTAGVNPFIRKRLKVLLRKLRSQGKTILLIEHDMDFVMSLSDEVIVLDAGKKLMADKPGKVRKNKKVLEAYLGK
ncbi:MAG: ABC transporter ATP-binding protein [Nanoarchaeota archaeon]|nr:ABC transporter ATP-binding protein [Nanoarchaeota archaeon]MBU1321046.1 ABC transporter ATP-binding protein [Nanoarchaeota archaeon]MBU1598115.1 ABC transporter ATP-binding protein [Nanoarchaeota archaeon]MBU2442321.1 ABC transporter ATP-binding protein [Nanoarchaeota archaeon]